MSKYKEESSKTGHICPYCKEEIACDRGRNFDHNEEIEECEYCHKKFIATAELMFTFYSKPDCKINGEDHDFAYLPGFKVNYCIKCGHMKQKK